jgi:uncharacterized protein
MLIEFSVGNYRSFKEKVTFSMVAANLVSQDKSLDSNNVFAVDEELSLVKSAAIYGANASGKSNLAKALQFMKWFMVNSSKETQSNEQIFVDKFRLSTETENQPSFFELVFMVGGQQHRYGFTANQERVISEWLFYIPESRETRLFERENGKFNISKTYKSSGVEERTRNNALFLSVSAQFNIKKSEEILNWLTNQFILTSGLNDEPIQYMFREDIRDQVIQLLGNMDLGINGVDLQRLDIDKYEKHVIDAIKEESDSAMIRAINVVAKNRIENEKDNWNKNIKAERIVTLHHKFNSAGEVVSLEPFSLLGNESDGTQKIFALASLLVYSLNYGTVLVIDEFDARLHPLMSQSIINLFNSSKTNPKNAQLILTTHDTNLLSNKIFRRDQIWFTEKDKYGATALYSLAEYKVRNDASYGSDYIKGKYGAIPYIQGAESLIEVHG